MTISSTGFPGESWGGQVKSLSAELSTIGRRAVGEAICAITLGEQRLPVNSNVDLTFTSRELSRVLLVPMDAVFQVEGRNYVYVVNNGRLQLREVQVGPATRRPSSSVAGCGKTKWS